MPRKESDRIGVVADPAEFNIYPSRGFLPYPDPLKSLPKDFEKWEKIAADMPRLLGAGQLRPMLRSLIPRDVTELTRPQQERAMLLLSFFAHGYVWENWKEKPENLIPEGVAVPFSAIAKRLGRPPLLSYASYALHNWRRLDSKGPIALGNIALLQNFLGGLDEDWFILVHVDIEATAGAAIFAGIDAQSAVLENDDRGLEKSLDAIGGALAHMRTTLERMPEQCDPYIYYTRVRPYIHGWKDHPALPDGVVYEGVAEFHGKPQKFRGETGAQSSIVPCLDAFLGVTHENDPLRPYLAEMRDYMPPKHRAFIEAVERGPSIRDYLLARVATHSALCVTYNECLE